MPAPTPGPEPVQRPMYCARPSVAPTAGPDLWGRPFDGPLLPTYLDAVHNVIHWHLAGEEYEEFDKLPPSAPVNDRSLCAAAVIHVKPNGLLESVHLVHSSGLAQFDDAVIRAIENASLPLLPWKLAGPWNTGRRIVWEFRRDPFYACSPRFARLVSP
jgi:TonB family protein